MSVPMPYRLIDREILRFEAARPRERPRATDGPAAPSRVVTISRQLGSGGRKVAEYLGEQLGWPVWDREILDVLASQSNRHLEARLLDALDEQARGEVTEMIAGMVTGVSAFSYYYLLPKAILIIAQKDAIIVGRGAHLVLPDALNVRVVAPMEVRVRNVVTYDGVDEVTAHERVRESDRERAAFVRALARHLGRKAGEGDPETEYDLVVNTGALPVPKSAPLVLAALQARFDLEA